MSNGSDCAAKQEITRLERAVIQVEEAAGEVRSLRNKANNLSSKIYGSQGEREAKVPEKSQSDSFATRLEEAAEKIRTYTSEAKEVLSLIV